ncbi:MAG: hypothetical protein K6B46_04215 [Opitutales bacterium]|nr:hypothetical protein [Opitutales bacterium]
MMTFEKFSAALSPIFEGAFLEPSTRFRELPSWGSLAGLSMIAVIDDEFGVLLSGNDIRSADTAGELFELAVKKQ